MSFQETLNKLKRSNRDRMIAGVCSGIAETTETPVWVWRAGFILLAISAGSGILAYIILWIFMPRPDNL